MLFALRIHVLELLNAELDASVFHKADTSKELNQK